jgi:hypothetical protein
VLSLINPVTPDEDVPEVIDTSPLTPASPALAEVISIAPLDVAAL